MPNEQLLAYIRSELEKGVRNDDLTRSLLNTGWKVEDINVAMATLGRQNTPPSPPASRIPTPLQSTHGAVAYPQTSSTKTIVQNTAASLFIACVSILTVVSIMGVWDIFSEDVITKSFQTLGLLAFVAIVVIVASKFVGDPSAEAEQPVPRPGYRAIRNITLATLIASSSLLALFGVLAIWDVVTGEIFEKSLTSLAIIAFSSFIIVLVCLEREQNRFWKKHAKSISGGGVIGTIVLIWLLFAVFSSLI